MDVSDDGFYIWAQCRRHELSRQKRNLEIHTHSPTHGLALSLAEEVKRDRPEADNMLDPRDIIL